MLIAPFHQVKLNFLLRLRMAKGRRSCTDQTVWYLKGNFFLLLPFVYQFKTISHPGEEYAPLSQMDKNNKVILCVEVSQYGFGLVSVKCNHPQFLDDVG